jgi:type IV secretory pathway TrbD component
MAAVTSKDPEHTPREEPIYPALWKPRLWFGCHPVLLVIVGFCTLMLVPVGLLTHNVWWMALGALAMMLAIPPLRSLARVEPDIIEVLPRYRTYARHYSAVGSVGSPLPSPRRHQR